MEKTGANSAHYLGTTSHGGRGGAGTIFQIDTNGNKYQILHHFQHDWSTDDYCDYQPCFVNGIYYGVSCYGGVFQGGTLFTYDTLNKSYGTLHHFDTTSVPMDYSKKGKVQSGNSPHSGVTFFDNKLYGTTESGGNYGWGVIYEFDLLTSTYTTLYSFDNGAKPKGSLFVTNDGQLIGLAERPSRDRYKESDYNFIYKFCLKQLTFRDVGQLATIAKPDTSCSFTEGEKGVLYFFTPSFGGTNYSLSEFYSYNYINDEILDLTILGGLYDICGNSYGSACTLTKIEEGKFLGALGKTLFEYDYLNRKVVKEVKLRNDPEFIEHFLSNLIFDKTENSILGTFFRYSKDKELGDEILFKYLPHEGRLVELYTLETGSEFGHNQKKYFIQDNYGNIYYESNHYDPTYCKNTKCFKQLHSQQNKSTILIESKVKSGERPLGIIKHKNSYYGTCEKGGNHDSGVIFEFNPFTKEFNVLIHFTEENRSFSPCKLFHGPENKLFGALARGGKNKLGYLFEFNPIDNSIISVFDFTNDYHLVTKQIYLLGKGNFAGFIDSNFDSRQSDSFFTYNLFEKSCNSKKINKTKGPISNVSPGKLHSNGRIYRIATLEEKKSDTTVEYLKHCSEYNPVTNEETILFSFPDSLVTHGDIVEANNTRLYVFAYLNSTKYICEIDITEKTFNLKNLGYGSNLTTGIILTITNNIIYGVNYEPIDFQGGRLFSYNIDTEVYETIIGFTGYNGLHPNSLELNQEC